MTELYCLKCEKEITRLWSVQVFCFRRTAESDPVYLHNHCMMEIVQQWFDRHEDQEPPSE